MSLVVGSVSYLNAAPLLEGLAGEAGLTLRLESPARIADHLRAGSLAVGLVPVIEAARQGLIALPGPAIATRGPVRSVLLHARVPLEAVRTLALDPASRTSQALVRILLHASFGLEPILVDGPAEGDPLAAGADAALIIGDRAMLPAPDDRRVIDLGRWWREMTGLPFVFAVWAGQDASTLRTLAPRLLRARERGLASLDAIARREADVRGIDAAAACAYLREAIHYDAGPEERSGLLRFLELARERSLVDGRAAMRWLDTGG
jgi:chorismate dehydratase